MFFPETGNQQLNVVAIYGVKDPVGDYLISTQTFDANIPTHVDDDVLVTNAPGVSTAEARDCDQQRAEGLPDRRADDEVRSSRVRSPTRSTRS